MTQSQWPPRRETNAHAAQIHRGSEFPGGQRCLNLHAPDGFLAKYTPVCGVFNFFKGGRPMANNIINNAPQMHRNFHIYMLYFVYINHETKQYDVSMLRWSYPRLNVQIFAFVNATSIRVGQIFLCAGWQLLLQIKQFALVSLWVMVHMYQYM